MLYAGRNWWQSVFSLFLFCSFIHYDNNINMYQYIGLFLFFFPPIYGSI